MSASDTPSAADSERDKAFAAAAARAALAGYTLHRIDGAYLICRWDRSRELNTLGDVERFLDAVASARD